MSLVENGNGGNGMVMPVTPMGNGYGYGGGMGNMMGMDGGYFFYMLFLFFFMMLFGNGFGGFGGYGGNGGGAPYVINQTSNEMQRGFDQQAIMGGLNGITSQLAGAEVSRCNIGNNIIQSMNNGFNSIQQGITQSQIAQMQQDFNGQMQQMQNSNNLAMSLQNCCCENRAGLADLKYNIATEACADRQAVNDIGRDIIASNTANTQSLLNTINNGIQSLHDKLCQQEIDALKNQNANLQTQLNLANLKGSQDAQTAQILAGQVAQANAIEQYVNPTARPAYIVQNPNCCAHNNYGCGSCGQCGGSY